METAEASSGAAALKSADGASGVEAPALEKQASGLVEWLTRRGALGRARAQGLAPDASSLSRAQAALALVERLQDPALPLREGDASSLALDLCRQAIYWALRALHGKAFAAPTLAAAFDETAPVWRQAAADAAELATVRGLLERDRFDEMEAQGVGTAAGIRQALTLARRLVALAEGQNAGVRRLQLQRVRRLGGAAIVAVVALALAAGAVGHARRPADLAFGKAWRASSSKESCTPAEHACAGATTDILFHTEKESSPWFEIDLAQSTVVGRVQVVNRSDCCQDRAVPLVVELSDDGKDWTEVARRKHRFGTWSASFPGQKARYVRVRALKTTYLHLERVSVFPG